MKRSGADSDRPPVSSNAMTARTTSYNSGMLSFLRQRILTRENALAAFLCAMLIALAVLTADASPQWIYQGF
jgi:hypothetical protein